jgi:hypothetical protein
VAGLLGVVISHVLHKMGPRLAVPKTSAGVAGTTGFRDDVRALLLHLELDRGHQEWLVFNPQ